MAIVSELAWTFCRPDELASRADMWDGLVTSAGYPAFMRTDFLVPAIETWGTDNGLVAFGSIGPRLTVAAILERVRISQWQTFQPSQLPLGAWVMVQDCNWASALRSVLRALPGPALVISVTQQDPNLVVRPDAGHNVELVDYVQTGWIDISGSFAAFWAARGKNLRQNLSKQRSKLETEAGPLRFNFLERPRDIQEALIDYVRLESAGWKSKDGSAVSENNDQGRFYRHALSRMSNTGAAFAIHLSLGNRPIAVDFGVRDKSSLVILKTTYDETLRGYSPAQLLHQQAFEYMFEIPGARRVEFYGKLMEWHTRWTNEARTLFHINYYRYSLLQQARRVLKKLDAGFASQLKPDVG